MELWRGKCSNEGITPKTVVLDHKCPWHFVYYSLSILFFQVPFPFLLFCLHMWCRIAYNSEEPDMKERVEFLQVPKRKHPLGIPAGILRCWLYPMNLIWGPSWWKTFKNRHGSESHLCLAPTIRNEPRFLMLEAFWPSFPLQISEVWKCLRALILITVFWKPQ